jgi:hypothetical protein
LSCLSASDHIDKKPGSASYSEASGHVKTGCGQPSVSDAIILRLRIEVIRSVMMTQTVRVVCSRETIGDARFCCDLIVPVEVGIRFAHLISRQFYPCDLNIEFTIGE